MHTYTTFPCWHDAVVSRALAAAIHSENILVCIPHFEVEKVWLPVLNQGKQCLYICLQSVWTVFIPILKSVYTLCLPHFAVCIPLFEVSVIALYIVYIPLFDFSNTFHLYMVKIALLWLHEQYGIFPYYYPRLYAKTIHRNQITNIWDDDSLFDMLCIFQVNQTSEVLKCMVLFNTILRKTE